MTPSLSPSASRILSAALKSDEELASELKKVLSDLRLSIDRFSKLSGIPSSTIKKILKAQGGITLSTLRKILNAIESIEGGPKTPFIAVIAAVTTLSKVRSLSLKFQDLTVMVKEYGVSTLDEAIKAALKAQSEGAAIIVCAPIVAQFIKDLISIPIVTLDVCNEDLERAVKIAAEKIVKKAEGASLEV
ncbi:MAG: PrpR N-terminal domain-containing protein [Candidatus Nezhaarchaeales archaeon]